MTLTPPFVERLLLLGASPLAAKLIEEIEARPEARCQVVGIADDPVPGLVDSLGRRLLGPIQDLDRILRECAPHRVIVTLTARRGRLPVQDLLAARMMGIVIEDGVEAYERLTGKVAIEALAPSAVIFSKDFRSKDFRKSGLAVGQMLAPLAAGLAAVFLCPLFVLIALAILLDSGRPVFFLQDRVGAFGRHFRLIKFRTMRATDRPSSEWAGDNGHRITRVGKWLRRFRLDELPQFINVLRGDMNLVGPRPHPTCNYRLFTEKIPYYSLRATVRPGITGWAQVRYGYANDLAEETEKMRYDLFYIKHLSPWLDLRILLETVRAVLLGRGARGRTHAADAPAGTPAPVILGTETPPWTGVRLLPPSSPVLMTNLHADSDLLRETPAVSFGSKSIH